MDAKYWKKFENAILERDKGGIMTQDINFCSDAQKANMCAIAVSARVDLYNLQRKNENEVNDFADEYGDYQESLKPRTQLFKFDDIVTSINLRSDGNLLLAGEQTGRIQLFELNNKFILRSYSDFSK